MFAKPLTKYEPGDVARSMPARGLRLPGGECIAVRPIGRRDVERLQAYVRGLSAETRRNRFLGAVDELAPALLDRIAHMDQPDQLALLAFAENGNDFHMVAEAMLVMAADGQRCEIGLSVADAWQGLGLGTLVLQDLECRARQLGARYLYGDVLRTNTAMKSLARKAGFAIRSPFTDARLVEIVKDLAPGQQDDRWPEPSWGSMPRPADPCGGTTVEAAD